MDLALNRVYKKKKSDRRRLKEYPKDWIGTRYQIFGAHNYGYVFAYPDSRFPNWTRDDFMELAEKSTQIGFYFVAAMFLDIASTEGIWKALKVLAILLAGNELYSYNTGDNEDFYWLSGSSGVYGGLCGYCLAKYGVFPLTFHGPTPGAVGFYNANFIAYNFIRGYMTDKTTEEEGGDLSGNIDHTIHFGTMAAGALLQKLL